MFCAGCIDLVAQTHPMLDFQLFPNLPGQRCSSVLLYSPYSIPTYEEFPREDPLTSSSRYLYKNRSFVCVLTLSSLPGPPTEPRKKKSTSRDSVKRIQHHSKLLNLNCWTELHIVAHGNQTNEKHWMQH